MFIVNDMPQQISQELIDLLEKVETATVGHFLHSGFVDRELRAVLPEKRVAGTAVTIRTPARRQHCSSLPHEARSSRRYRGHRALRRHAPCLLGRRHHPCDEIAGVKAGVVDGPATDFSEIRNVEMPMWCRGPSPITTKILGLEGAINVPVTVGGQVIEPGDAILADESGVIALRPSQAKAVAERAIGMQEAEIKLLERLRNGEKLPDISGATKFVEEKLLRV